MNIRINSSSHLSEVYLTKKSSLRMTLSLLSHEKYQESAALLKASLISWTAGESDTEISSSLIRYLHKNTGNVGTPVA